MYKISIISIIINQLSVSVINSTTLYHGCWIDVMGYPMVTWFL